MIFRRTIVLAALLSAAFFSGVIAKPALARLKNGESADHPSHQMRLDQFRRLQASPAKVVMLGDSFVENGEWSEWLGPGVVNRGIGQNTTDDIIDRLSYVPLSETAVLMIGSNDLARGDTPAEVAERTQKIVSLLGRQVIVLAVLPRLGKDNAPVNALNRLNADHCATGRCTFVDVRPALTLSGDLNPAMTLDGIHLNGEGYARLAGDVRAALAS